MEHLVEAEDPGPWIGTLEGVDQRPRCIDQTGQDDDGEPAPPSARTSWGATTTGHQPTTT